MAYPKNARLARVVGGALLVIGALYMADSFLAVVWQSRLYPRSSVTGPVLLLLGLMMALFPGSAPPESMADGDLGRAFSSIKNTLRGLRPWQAALWIAGLVGGVVVGLLYLALLKMFSEGE